MTDYDKEVWRDLILTVFGKLDIDKLIEKYPEFKDALNS